MSAIIVWEELQISVAEDFLCIHIIIISERG